MSTTQSDATEGVEYANGLRALADLMDAHPELAGYDVTRNVFVQSLDEMTALARKIGGTWTKHSLGDYLFLRREVAPGVRVEINIQHHLACERVVVGTETIEREVPDPEQVEQIPLVTVTETVEKVEWRCPPSFLAGQAVKS